MTAPVWIRGALSDHYGVPVDSVTYFTGGEEEPGWSEKLKLDLPGNIRVEPIGPTQTLSQMLLDGEIDALYTARMPSSFLKCGGRVKRLATAALKTMLPWLTAHLDDARNEMGDDFWPYGFDPNRKALETFLRYHFEQGLSKRLLAPGELFAPESLESFKI